MAYQTALAAAEADSDAPHHPTTTCSTYGGVFLLEAGTIEARGGGPHPTDAVVSQDDVLRQVAD